MKFPAAHPAVIGSVTTLDGLSLLGAEQTPADAIEVRVDALLAQGVPVEQIESALEDRKHPVLLTLRIPDEGGHHPWEDGERNDLYERLLPFGEAIDIELATAPGLKSVVAAALATEKTVVLSAHAFLKSPPPEQFSQWLKLHEAFDPKTILKVAAHIDTWRDLQRLAALLVNYPEKQIAVMGLGPHAPQSRSVLAALGSRLVYGWIDHAAAPGQPSASEVRKMIEALPPRE
jgi:3-dehydroquinate dehydratase-1